MKRGREEEEEGEGREEEVWLQNFLWLSYIHSLLPLPLLFFPPTFLPSLPPSSPRPPSDPLSFSSSLPPSSFPCPPSDPLSLPPSSSLRTVLSLAADSSETQFTWLQVLQSMGLEVMMATNEVEDQVRNARSIFEFEAKDVDGNVVSLERYRYT